MFSPAIMCGARTNGLSAKKRKRASCQRSCQHKSRSKGLQIAQTLSSTIMSDTDTQRTEEQLEAYQPNPAQVDLDPHSTEGS